MDENHGNLSASDNNVTNAMLEVQLYAAIWSGFLALVLTLLGILPNCALLVATRCKRQLQMWSSALIYNICICNIVFCLIWIPLNFGLVVSNYYHNGVNFVACYLHLALFHFCVAEVVTSTLLLAAQRLYGLWSRGAGRIKGVLAVAAVVFTAITGCTCAASASFNHSRTYSLASCTRSFGGGAFQNDSSTSAVLESNSADTVLCLIYVASSTSTCAVFLVLGMCRRQNANAQSPAEGRHRCNYQGVPSVECGTDDDRVNTSVCSQPSPTKSSLRDSGDAKKSSGTLSVSKRVCLQEPKDEDVHAIGNATSGSNDDVINDDDDDDQFDLKMRMKIGKCKRSSGRRHTVANIGTAEANFKGRRGSVDNQRGSANQLNYQYIRKWSVDIVALQEQLENPKLHPLPLEELVNFREKAQKSQPNETKASETGAETRKDESTATRGKEAELRMIKEQLSEEGDNVPSGNDPKSKTAADYRGTQAPNQNETKQRTTTKANENEVTISVCYAEDPSSSSVEVPAITIRANKCNELQDDVMIQTYDMPELTSNGDSQYDAKIKHKLTYTWRSIAHVLVVVVALVPLCIFLATFDDDISVRYVLMTVVLIQCPLQPLLIMWSDPIVEQAVRRLKLKMLSLRCVCYCNIGKGKRCLGRPPEYQ